MARKLSILPSERSITLEGVGTGATLRGDGESRMSRVNLRGLPKGRYSVRIKLELANGKTISGVRRYFTCRPGRKSGPPRV